MKKVIKAPQREYEKFCKYFSFSCVDLLIFEGDTILLSKRTREPYRGRWHLPGSIIHKNERMKDVVLRSAREELNLKVRIKKYLGVYESLNFYRHDISHAFIVSIENGKIKQDFQSSSVRFFKKIPQNILPHHRKMIQDAKNL